MNVLFVCSKNQWRSPTAEAVWKNEPGVNTRSAGTSRSARRRLTAADLRWADVVCVMEEKHKSRIKSAFRDEVRHTPIEVLDIPDDYRYMDEELVELALEKVAPIVGVDL